MVEERPRFVSTLGLYLKLSSILIPSFAGIAAIGLYFLTERLVSDASDELGARVGNAAARVANGVERLAEKDHASGVPLQQAGHLLNVLMADPAVACVEIRALDGATVVAAPKGLECAAQRHDATLSLSIYFPDDMDLVVRYTLDELDYVRVKQHRVAGFILAAGLVVALLTNWLSFRVIIGRPLRRLIRDIEATRALAETRSLQDSLTGIANRRRLDLELRGRLADAALKSRALAVLHLDLDRFKEINDAHGHAAGDAVLIHVAEALVENARADDFVARVGGDEFVLLLSDVTDRFALVETAQKLCAVIDRDVAYEHRRLRCAASVGVFLMDPSEGAPPAQDQALINADIALYAAKSQGSGTVAFFEPCLRERIDAEKKLVGELRCAIERDEFVPYYQTQHDARTGAPRSVEALVRWRHPERGLLAPYHFLDLAERYELIDQIDAAVLRRTVRDLQGWDAEGVAIETVSVNLSTRRLLDSRLVDDLIATQIAPERYVFEVLETVDIDALPAEAKSNLDRLRALGSKIEIDDFGTGRASIVGVMAVAPNALKIAKELILPLVDEPQRRHIVEAIAALARTLDVSLIAEGVETLEHAEVLRDLGFDKLQGYAYTRPAPADAVSAFFRDQSWNIPNVA